jgi:Mitogen-activated protein kinase kinase 1 interacting
MLTEKTLVSTSLLIKTTAMVSLLPSSLQGSLTEIVERSNQRGAGIRALLLSTMEGVALGRVIVEEQQLNEDVLASIESVWAPASKQFPVLGLDKVKQVTAIYDHGTLVHIYQAPIVSEGNICAHAVRSKDAIIIAIFGCRMIH